MILFHVYDFRRGKLAAIFLTLGYDQMCDKSFYISFIVDKCTIDNGGCDVSAVCTNPTLVGEDVVCSCATGKQFASDGRTCTSTADAEKHCPTSTCWTYEMVEGENKCVMKLRV